MLNEPVLITFCGSSLQPVITAAILFSWCSRYTDASHPNILFCIIFLFLQCPALVIQELFLVNNFCNRSTLICDLFHRKCWDDARVRTNHIKWLTRCVVEYIYFKYVFTFWGTKITAFVEKTKDLKRAWLCHCSWNQLTALDNEETSLGSVSMCECSDWHDGMRNKLKSKHALSCFVSKVSSCSHIIRVISELATR